MMEHTYLASARRSKRIGQRVLWAMGIVCLTSGQAMAANQPAAADVESARGAFVEGHKALEQGRPREALHFYQAAADLVPTPIIFLEMGKAHRALGELLEAREAWLRVGRIEVDPQESLRSAEARREATDLAESVRAQIPTVQIVVEGAPLDQIEISIDGARIPGRALALARPVNPGKHDIVGDSSTGERVTVSVSVEPSARGTARLVFRAPAASVAPKTEAVVQPTVPAKPVEPETPRPVDRPQKRPTPWVAIGAFGVAGAGAIVGSIAGIAVLGHASSMKSDCPDHACAPALHGTYNDAHTGATIANIAFGVAGASALVGLGALLWSGPGREKARALPEGARQWAVHGWLGAGSLGVAGTF